MSHQPAEECRSGMAPSDQFFLELKRAIARGFTLAAVSVSLSCSGPSIPPGDGGSGGGGGMVATGGGGGGTAVAPPPRDLDGGSLTQVPSGSIECTGDAGSVGPFFGSCCTDVYCYQPTTETCAGPNEIGAHTTMAFNPSLPPGSGTCMCGQTQGPFAQPDGGDTRCCYVVGSIGCTGRPLREEERAVVAAVVVRSDWA